MHHLWYMTHPCVRELKSDMRSMNATGRSAQPVQEYELYISQHHLQEDREVLQGIKICLSEFQARHARGKSTEQALHLVLPTSFPLC